MLKSYMWVALLVAVLGSLPQTAVRAASAGKPWCAVLFRSGMETCLPAAQLTQAERQAPFAIRGTAAVVSAVSGLSLTQVIVARSDLHRVTGIHYIFGRLKPDQDLMGLPGSVSAATPRFVLVQEIPGVIVPTHVTVTRASLGHGVFTPWELTMGLSRRRLSVIVTSNGRPSDVRQIGTRLVAQANQRT